MDTRKELKMITEHTGLGSLPVLVGILNFRSAEKTK